MVETVDQVARDKASETAHNLRNHITVTDYRLQNMEKKIDLHHDDQNTKLERLESILKWAGGLIVMLFISTLTWSLAQQYNANEASKKDMAQQIELLQAQQRNSSVARQDRQEILSRLPESGATQATGVPNAGR